MNVGFPPSPCRIRQAASGHKRRFQSIGLMSAVEPSRSVSNSTQSGAREEELLRKRRTRVRP